MMKAIMCAQNDEESVNFFSALKILQLIIKTYLELLSKFTKKEE